MLDVDWMSLVLPFAYLFVLGGSLMIFSTVYRKRKAAQAANLAPWFPPHLQRNIYLSLLHLEPAGGQKAQKVPDSILRAALLRRAVEDINRIIQIRTAKQACSTLLQRGSVGDDLWQRFLRAEKEMEEELRDVVMEANALAQNWGQVIFQSANEIAANTKLRNKLEEVQAQADTEKTWGKAKKRMIKKDLLGPEEASKASKPSASSSRRRRKSPARRSSTSDEDSYLLDPSAPVVSIPAAPSTPANSSSKKKRGKK